MCRNLILSVEESNLKFAGEDSMATFKPPLKNVQVRCLSRDENEIDTNRPFRLSSPSQLVKSALLIAANAIDNFRRDGRLSRLDVRSFFGISHLEKEST